MHRFLYIFSLFAFLTASAQQMPERRQVRMGNRAYNRSDYTTGIDRYSRAWELAPGSFEAGYDLGNALYKAEMFDKAEQTMQRAAADTLRTTEERAWAYYNLGNAQFKQQKYKEALESYRQSLRLDPTDMETKYNYAYTKKLLDDQQQDGGGGGDNDQNQDKDQQGGDDSQNGGQNDDPNDSQNDPQQEPGEEAPDDNSGENSDEPRDGDGQPTPSGISEQEQQQMLDAIQAQEDRTQDKLKEKQGVIVRGKKNW